MRETVSGLCEFSRARIVCDVSTNGVAGPDGIAVSGTSSVAVAAVAAAEGGNSIRIFLRKRFWRLGKRHSTTKGKSMDRERAKELLPIIQAWLDRKPIEIRWSADKPWHLLLDESVNWDASCEFHIKPEPKYRSFNAEEMPLLVGYSVKHKETGDVSIVARWFAERKVVTTNGKDVTPQQLFENYILLVPTGAFVDGLCQLEEKPCGVLEDA